MQDIPQKPRWLTARDWQKSSTCVLRPTQRDRRAASSFSLRRLYSPLYLAQICNQATGRWGTLQGFTWQTRKLCGCNVWWNQEKSWVLHKFCFGAGRHSLFDRCRIWLLFMFILFWSCSVVVFAISLSKPRDCQKSQCSALRSNSPIREDQISIPRERARLKSSWNSE